MKAVWKAMVKKWQLQHVGEVLTKKQFPAGFENKQQKKTQIQVATLENASHGFC